MSKLYVGGAMVAMVLTASVALAMPPTGVLGNLETPGTQRSLVLPVAADNSPVISLGSAVDPQSGKVVQGYAIVRYKGSFNHKPNHNPGGGSGGPGGATTSCFGFLSKDAKWKTVEPWVVNGATVDLTSAFVLANLTDDIAKWEDAANGVLGDVVSVDVFGNGVATTSSLIADTVSPDGVNEVYFADITDSGAIGVTIVWGIFGGPPSGRELVEWDQVYDDIDFAWSPSGEAGKMDFESIATHELGHSFGLKDLYTSECSNETMYGFASEGETNKRTLEAGDIEGANKLY